MDRHHFPCSIQCSNFYSSLDLCTSEPGEGLRGVYHQLAPLLNHVAHVVGQAAARIGDVRPLGENLHLPVRPLPLQLGRYLGPGGYAAYNQYVHKNLIPFPSAFCRLLLFSKQRITWNDCYVKYEYPYEVNKDFRRDKNFGMGRPFPGRRLPFLYRGWERENGCGAPFDT